MQPQYQKVKSVSKKISYGTNLSKKVLDTLETIATVVGGTLGPGGKPVLIERYESDLPPMITKDGVTVFKHLGFEDATSQTILECARDAAIKTAISAGDGTTTATILSYALVKSISDFCTEHPQESPQKIVRTIESLFSKHIEPFIKSISMEVKLDNEVTKKMLWGVANVSANGDTQLADAVLRCFDLVGDEGNVTITEASGPSAYEVEKINGYTIGNGYEESCNNFYPKFVNDIQNQRVYLERPVFLLYYGKITEMGVLHNFIQKLLSSSIKNVVVISTGFSDTVIGQLAYNFDQLDTKRIYPLVVPLSPQINGQLDLLRDLSAITGAKVFDPMNHPVESIELYDLGPGVEYFESLRFRSNVVGYATGTLLNPDLEGTYEDLLFLRIEELKGQLTHPESQFDKILIQERLAKVADGIAKLRVIGSSNGEIKEKKDRAEDAICAVRGAIQHGCLPGAAFTYEFIKHMLGSLTNEDILTDSIIHSILYPVFSTPFDYLLENAGFSENEKAAIYGEFNDANPMMSFRILSFIDTDPFVYDILSKKLVRALDVALLDSTPAVLEAIRNSISIASILGTLGGAVVFGRNEALENEEASKTIDFLKSVQSH